jgi:hypothetical protein
MTPDERRAAKRAWYMANRDDQIAKKRAWYAANAEKARGYSRMWRIRNGQQPDIRLVQVRWDAKRVAQLRQLRAEGKSYAECGEALGCTKLACDAAAERYGIFKRAGKSNPTPLLPKHSPGRRETTAQSRMWATLLRAAV